MDSLEVSEKQAEYILALFELGEASVGELAERLNLSKPTVSLTLKKLAEKGLVTYCRRGVVRLSPRGLVVACELVWRHGVIEVAFVKLGLTPKEACKVAKMIQYKLPRDVVESMWRNLGRPCKCPHGLEFPTPSNFGKVKRGVVCRA